MGKKKKMPNLVSFHAMGTLPDWAFFLFPKLKLKTPVLINTGRDENFSHGLTIVLNVQLCTFSKSCLEPAYVLSNQNWSVKFP